LYCKIVAGQLCPLRSSRKRGSVDHRLNSEGRIEIVAWSSGVVSGWEHNGLFT
jgi:hypothetical protein